ncbi:MAG: magnesium transporter [Verrucomicrobiota bacterium]|nr:magnesium transporter [Verrucomicrobiota bacterium]
MIDPASLPDFDEPIAAHARKDLPLLQARMSVHEALDTIRREGVGERVIYFYATDEHGRLVGVLPTRRLLTAPLETSLEEIMIRRVVALPATATVLEACEFFVLYKFFAFPVVDAQRRVIGVVDVSLFRQEMLEAGDRDEEPTVAHPPPDEFFEALGFRLSQIKDASPLRMFRYRFPWLLATVGSGTACAMLAGVFEATLAGSVVIAFFLTMVLGLNESVSMQSMPVTIQALRTTALTRRWFVATFRREAKTAALLGLGCGTVVSVIVWLWRGEAVAAAVIGSSIAVSLVTACLFGLTVPSILHSLKLDPKIAAGPVTLAFADFFALAFYFGLAAAVLR